MALLAASQASAVEPLCNSLSGLGNAVEALRQGDGMTAARAAQAAWKAHPLGALGSQAAATLGLALLAVHRPAEAVGPLQAALSAPPAGLSGELQLALGQALLESGRPTEALGPLAEAARPGLAPTRERARWLEAEALLAAGRVDPASGRLESLLAGSADDAAARRGRLLLAGARRLAGRTVEALAAYRALAVDAADLPEGSAAAAALEAWAGTGEARARLTAEDRIRRAERLLQRARPSEALAEAERAVAELSSVAGSSVAARPAVLAQALALAALGRLGEAIELAEPLTAASDPGVRRGSQWLLARWASRAGRIDEASARHATVARDAAVIPGLGERRSREVGDESAYLSAWLWYDAGDFMKAAPRLDAFVRARPASPRADDARWFAAWAAFRAGDRRGAQVRLARLENGALADAALYWQGRLGGGTAWARERLRRAALAGGDGWYGWLARRRLEQLGAAPPRSPLPPQAPLRPLPEASMERLRLASALWGLGARDRALQALPARPASRSEAEEVCRIATFTGEPALALRVARDHLGQGPGAERWLYPMAFVDQLAPAARATGLDEPLLLALVRRESGFRLDARSVAGAVGLGQLVPMTADRLGLLLQLSDDPRARLADPGTSLPLAALYLGLLRDRFGSDVGALAAYNAGPEAPIAWSAARAGQPLDEWVENVPYKETRVYLKAVLSAREVYRRLEGLPPRLDPAAPVPAPGIGVAF